MSDPRSFVVILGRSGPSSLSGHKLAASFGGVFDPRQRSRCHRPALSVPPSTEDTMRIFERLRGRSRSESAIERKLFEAVTDDLLRKLEDETSIPVFTESKANCCSCCSAEERRLSRHDLAPDQCAPIAFGENNRRCAALPRATGFRSRLPLTIATSTRPRPRGRDRGVAFPCRCNPRRNVWMDEALLIHPTNWKSWRWKTAIWKRSCWPRACQRASQRPALPFRPAERPWPGRHCRAFRPRSSPPSPCRSEAGT